jgi:hypothetical protein
MNQTADEHLDRLTKTIASAGGISDGDAERIGSSPFLHTRVRARIEGEQRKREEQGSGWLATLLVASRAIAALLLVTLAAASAFWVTKSNAANGNAPENSRADDLNRVLVGGACALSSTEQCAISTEEVLATMFAEDRGNRDDGKEDK